MITFWEGIGLIRYPLTFSLLLVVLLTLWSAAQLFRPSAWADPRSKAWVDAVLFWGGFAMISGVLGTLVGVIVAAQSIEQAAGQVTPTLIWGGIKVALLSSALGLVVLALASLLWFGLQLRWRMLAADEGA